MLPDFLLFLHHDFPDARKALGAETHLLTSASLSPKTERASISTGMLARSVYMLCSDNFCDDCEEDGGNNHNEEVPQEVFVIPIPNFVGILGGQTVVFSPHEGFGGHKEIVT